MTMIASVLHLDRKAVKALRITDPYSLHRVVYSLYPDVRSDEDKTNSTPSGILYADQGGDFHGRKILLLANRMPESQVDGEFGTGAEQRSAQPFSRSQPLSLQSHRQPDAQGQKQQKANTGKRTCSHRRMVQCPG